MEHKTDRRDGGGQITQETWRDSGNTEGSYKPRCHKCGQLGHLRKDCTRKGEKCEDGKDKKREENNWTGRVWSVSWLLTSNCKNAMASPCLLDTFDAMESAFYADATVRMPLCDAAYLMTPTELQTAQRVMKLTDCEVYNVESTDDTLDDLQLGENAISTQGIVIVGDARVPANVFLDSGANISLIAPAFLARLKVHRRFAQGWR